MREFLNLSHLSPYSLGVNMHSFKRPLQDDTVSSTSESGPAKRSAKEGGGGAGGGAGAPPLNAPVPRHIGLWSHTIQLNCVSWEEIGNTVKWLPLHMFPQNFMRANGNQNYRMFERWLRSCNGYTLHKPKAHMSNFQFLQDAISVTSGVPETTTAPTQAAYIICFSPKNQNGEMFQIGVAGASAALGWHGDMGLGSVDYDSNHLVDLTETSTGSDTDFEKLAYNVTITGRSGILNQYAMASLTGPAGAYGHGGFAGILIQDGGTTKSAFYRNAVKNASHIKMLKHGDEFSWDIENNCDNCILKNLGNFGAVVLSDPASGTIAESSVTPLPTGSNINLYATNNPAFDASFQSTAQSPAPNFERDVFIWPTKENPPYSRKNGEASIGLLNHWKDTKGGHLNHKFFIMAPMKLPDGSLVKQRCSVMLEQKMDVTFWFRDDISDVTTNDPEVDQFNPYAGNPHLGWNMFRDTDYVLRPARLVSLAGTITPIRTHNIKVFV